MVLYKDLPGYTSWKWWELSETNWIQTAIDPDLSGNRSKDRVWAQGAKYIRLLVLGKHEVQELVYFPRHK